jgi:hypothetical protein
MKTRYIVPFPSANNLPDYDQCSKSEIDSSQSNDHQSVK